MVERLEAEEGPDVLRVRQLLFDIQSLKIWPGAELFADDLAPRDPFDDFELLDFLRHMPESFRREGRLQRLYLAGVRELADLPTTKEGLAPTVTGAAGASPRGP